MSYTPPPYNSLGRFVAPFTTEEGATVYLRGLKVSEYVDLAHRGFFSSQKQDMYSRVQIAQACIDGWENEIQKIYEGWTPLEIADELLTFEEMIKISQFVVEKLTHLSDDEEYKLQGYTRYVHEMSQTKNKKKAETFKCKNCILFGKHSSRKKFCGKFTPTQAAKYKRQLEESRSELERANVELVSDMLVDEQEAIRKLDRVTEAAGKYGSGKKRRRRGGGGAAVKRQDFMVINKFKFPQCPVSWLDEWIWVSGNMMYHAEKANITLFDGGMFDQPHKLYRASRVISSEFAKIDEEQSKLK